MRCKKEKYLNLFDVNPPGWNGQALGIKLISGINIVMNKEDNFYRKLKIRLDETTEFPSEYMFKFIIPSSKDKLIQIENIFNYRGAVISTKLSKTGKYNSITVLVSMKNAKEIIDKYKEVSSVEGVISL